MKKSIISALIGALAMLLSLVLVANIYNSKEDLPAVYNHINFLSNITQDECYICGQAEYLGCTSHWGEDNVGVVNLNTFEMLYLEINRYDDQGKLIEKPAGVMSSSGLSNAETESYVHAYCFPDNAYANVQLSGVQYAIDRDAIQSYLCQNCLDSINGLRFTDQPPAEFAIVSFEERTIQPLLNAHPWFSAGNFGIDCEFRDGGEIRLLIHYCPSRYKENPSLSDGSIKE